MIASYVAGPDEQAILEYLQAIERMGDGWRWLSDQSWVTEFELRNAVHLQHHASVRTAVTAGLVERVRVANPDHPSSRVALLRLSDAGRRVLATQGKLLGRDVIPLRRADPPVDSFLVYGSVWAVLKYLQEHPGWHERGRLLKDAGEQERSIRQPHADTAGLLLRYGWAEQCEEPRKGFTRPHRLLQVTERGLGVSLVADRHGRMVMVRSGGEPTPGAADAE